MTNFNKIKNKILKSKIEWAQLLWRILQFCTLVIFVFCAYIVYFEPIPRFEILKPPHFAIKQLVKSRYKKENNLTKQGDS